MSGPRSGFHPAELIVVPVVANRPLVAPHEPNDVDRLFQRLKGFSGGSAGPTDCPDGFPKGTGAEAKLETAAADEVDGGSHLGQNRRWSQGKRGDVREEPDVLGFDRQGSDQGEGIHEPTLVWMILNAHQVEAQVVSFPDEIDEIVQVGCVGHRKDPKLQFVSVTQRWLLFPLAPSYGPRLNRRSLAC